MTAFLRAKLHCCFIDLIFAAVLIFVGTLPSGLGGDKGRTSRGRTIHNSYLVDFKRKCHNMGLNLLQGRLLPFTDSQEKGRLCSRGTDDEKERTSEWRRMVGEKEEWKTHMHTISCS